VADLAERVGRADPQPRQDVQRWAAPAPHRSRRLVGRAAEQRRDGLLADEPLLLDQPLQSLPRRQYCSGLSAWVFALQRRDERRDGLGRLVVIGRQRRRADAQTLGGVAGDDGECSGAPAHPRQVAGERVGRRGAGGEAQCQPLAPAVQREVGDDHRARADQRLRVAPQAPARRPTADERAAPGTLERFEDVMLPRLAHIQCGVRRHAQRMERPLVQPECRRLAAQMDDRLAVDQAVGVGGEQSQ
jgi:hypothetical protein